MKKREKMINKQYTKYANIHYVMPFLFCNDLFIPVLAKLFEKEQNPVKYVYGTVKCAWAGGRPSSLSITSLPRINKYLKEIKKYNITPVFTFNCQSENKEILNDSFCNDLLDIAYQNNSHFIIATDMLYNHITSRYKDAHTVCSVINPHLKYLNSPFFNETKFYNEMLEKYEIVVIRPEWTFENIEKIDKIINDISRVEVLINQTCHYNCKSAKIHYQLNESFEAGEILRKDYNNQVMQICPKYKIEYKSVYMKEEIINKLIDKGIRLFKMQGRDLLFEDILDELYKFLFSNTISEQEIRNKIDIICAQLIQNNKPAQLSLL